MAPILRSDAANAARQLAKIQHMKLSIMHESLGTIAKVVGGLYAGVAAHTH